MKIVINISKEVYEHILKAKSVPELLGIDIVNTINAVKNGILLPKHVDLFDKDEILRFLKCPKYENCDWKNCFDCNESRCININNINDLIPIIKADKEE